MEDTQLVYPESFTLKDLVSQTGTAKMKIKAKVTGDLKRGVLKVVGYQKNGRRGRPSQVFGKV